MRTLLTLFLVALAACSTEAPPRDLDSLVLVDSVYTAPETDLPHTGPVFRVFADTPNQNEIEARLENGLFDGEIRVFHPNGRIRYQGFLAAGVKCGAWIENRDSLPPEDVLVELKQEIESMGIYPSCPG